MSKLKRVNLTIHSKDRLKERTGYPESFFKENVKYAFNKGIGLKHLKQKNILVYRTLYSNKKTVYKKYYKGYIYVFDNLTHTLITVYKLENEEAVKELEKIYKIRHKK